MVVENNAPSSLTNVCGWAYSQSSPDENHPDHYDHAVFLTRENFGPAGELSWLRKLVETYILIF